MSKYRLRNESSLWWFLVINAAIILCGFSITVFGQNIDVKSLSADLEPEIRRAMVEGKIPSATVALV